MPRNFEIRRRGKPGLPLAVGTQRDDGSCTAIFAGNGIEAASLEELLARFTGPGEGDGLSSTGVDVVFDNEAPR
jgi:hypothetical protein